MSLGVSVGRGSRRARREIAKQVAKVDPAKIVADMKGLGAATKPQAPQAHSERGGGRSRAHRAEVGDAKMPGAIGITTVAVRNTPFTASQPSLGAAPLHPPRLRF